MQVKGRRFKLNFDTVCIVAKDGGHFTEIIPAGNAVTVLAEPEHGQIEVSWLGQRVMMYTFDLRANAFEIVDLSKGQSA